MDYRKHKNIDPWDDRVFGTGNTMPPKEHGGIIALLLIAVIFLSGIVSALSFLNIKLFQQLNQQSEQPDTVPISFSDEEHAMPSAPTDISAHPDTYSRDHISGRPTLGLEGDTISRFDQYYFRIPAGLLLTDVGEDSDAAAQGIEPGDILISVDGTQIYTQTELDSIVYAHEIGDTVDVVIYRSGAQYSLTLTLTEAMG